MTAKTQSDAAGSSACAPAIALDRELAEVATRLNVNLSAVPEWVRELARRALTCADEHRGLWVVTPWGGHPLGIGDADPKLHDEYARKFRKLLAEVEPTLMPALFRAGAVIVISPGFAGFVYGDEVSEARQFLMPELIPLTLRAWTEPNPTLH